MRIVNCTPHELKLVRPDGSPVTLPKPSGPVARVASTSTVVGEVDGVPLFRASFGAVENLPAEEAGVVLVVSALVRAACPTRSDLASPGELVRDAGGNVIGARGLVVA